MFVVAVTAPGAGGAFRRRVAAVRTWLFRATAASAAAAGTVLRSVLTAFLAIRGLAGLALVTYGAWLAWEPAGFIVAGGLLLADRVGDERAARPDEERQ